MLIVRICEYVILNSKTRLCSYNEIKDIEIGRVACFIQVIPMSSHGKRQEGQSQKKDVTVELEVRVMSFEHGGSSASQGVQKASRIWKP